MSRRLVWLQVLLGWLPVWAFFTVLIVTAHHAPMISASLVSVRLIVAAAALGLVVQRLVERYPWPDRVTLTFVAGHVLAAAVFSALWLTLNSVIASIFERAIVIVVGVGLLSFFLVGFWLYATVAGVSYATQATERAARAEADAARAQLATLRAQLNPHFLFNALHTVVQLIPREPRRAAQAAEQVADLLRRAVQEDRDVVLLSEELAFVERYLEVERIRFGERLCVTIDVSDEARGASVPSFAAQTLVENAVRHGAAPRIEPTALEIRGSMEHGLLSLTVTDTGAGVLAEQLRGHSVGTGLKRLRERLAALYGGHGRLDISAGPSDRGVVATLLVPQERDD